MTILPPELLTGDGFQTLVDEQAAATARETAERENLWMRKPVQIELRTSWKEADDARKQRKERKTAYQEQLHISRRNRTIQSAGSGGLVGIGQDKISWWENYRGLAQRGPIIFGAAETRCRDEGDSDKSMHWVQDGGPERRGVITLSRPDND